jgi:hypothetical protein
VFIRKDGVFLRGQGGKQGFESSVTGEHFERISS